MDNRAHSPNDDYDEMDDATPPSSPAEDYEVAKQQPKKVRKAVIGKDVNKKKKRKEKSSNNTTNTATAAATAAAVTATTTTASMDDSKHSKKQNRKPKKGDPVQTMVNDQMRKALEEDQYSAVGSVVDTDSDEEESNYHSRSGDVVHLDRNTILAAMRKRVWMERQSRTQQEEEDYDKEHDSSRKTTKPSSIKKKPKVSEAISAPMEEMQDNDVMDRDEGSIFGQTQGASNATWVECDKCKKWRRLRGVVDEKKLPSKWYCSMNKNDAERARCSAPEEEYETPNTPESAADARTRKHLRVWVRRLESNETYEGRQPNMTRGKKRSATTHSKEPYEWIRCCNPSCGKWRVLLRVMDSKSLFSTCKDGEWYCVQNTWDEKMASCAAPQENLPAIGCPPWVMQDE